MIVFSELLKSFINEKNISVKKLAANVQMDRTLIQKYMSGSFENTGWCLPGAEGLYNIMDRWKFEYDIYSSCHPMI